MKKFIKTLLDYKVIFSIMIGAIGYGVGYNLPLSYGFHPIVCLVCCLVLGTMFDRIADKILSNNKLTDTRNKKIILAIFIYLIYIIAWLILDYSIDYDLDIELFTSILLYFLFQVISFVVRGIKTKLKENKKKRKKVYLGNVITVDDNNPNAEAIVVNGEIIEYVGNKEEALKIAGNNAEIIDYKENYIYPGFIESHCHGYFAGYRLIGQADLNKILTGSKDYVPVIKKYIEDNPGKDVYLAAGWNETGEILDHTFLDNIDNEKALVMNTSGGHSCLLNTKAMELFNINKDAVKKYGSNLVHVNENGQPTGYVCEGAAVYVLNAIKVKFEDAKEYILHWQETAFSKGYTAVCDAGTELLYKEANEVYAELENENKLKLRTYAFSIVEDNVEKPKQAIKKIVELKNRFNNKYFNIIGAKVFLDGVAEARTSWTIDGYNDEVNYHGLQRFSDEKKMIELITEASKNKLSVHAHSEGDGATDFFLNCIEKSQEITNDKDQRNIVAHLHFVGEKDFDRMAQTNSIPLVAPLWTPKFPGAYENEVAAYGVDKADNSYPIKSFFDRGCKVSYHTDYPISPILNATRSFYMAEKRTLPEEKEFGFGDCSRNVKEAVTRMDSLKALTINCAYALKQEKMLGSIEKNKIANFVVMDENLLTCPVDKIINVNLLNTIVDGEVVYTK